MNEFDEILTYSRSNNELIYSCQHCGMIYFIYKTLAITLYRFEFDALIDCLEKVEDKHFDFPHPNGPAATITFNKLEDGYFNITKPDLPELRHLLSEACLLMNVYRLIR